MHQYNLHVRELQEKDIDLISSYWTESSDEHLIGMGVDLDKLPGVADFRKMLELQISLPYDQKQAYALIWEVDGKAIGHSNINKIIYGNEAFMHLHIWEHDARKKGVGTQLVLKSLPFYFQNYQLKTLYCEPYALNSAPNKTLEKIGFEFQRSYTTIPGSINFEQEVNLWELTREKFETINLKTDANNHSNTH